MVIFVFFLTMDNLQQWLFSATEAAADAGKAILEVYSSADFQISLKTDRSPLTKADRQADQKIRERLHNSPFPILSEESGKHDYRVRSGWENFWLVDPLDGTKEFISRNDEFTVNIALISNRKPVLGVIYLPVYDQMYFASKETGAYRIDGYLQQAEKSEDPEIILHQGIQLPGPDGEIRSVMVSRSHLSPDTTAYLKKLEKKTGKLKKVTAGSSLKLCRIAEGYTGMYPRLGPTMEWDIAAGVAIVTFSGGKVTTPDGQEMSFNKENLLNPWFIAVSKSFREAYPDYL